MAETSPFEVDDAIVLLLGAPSRSPALRNRISGITRLEKLLFLLEKETDLGALMTEDTGFVAHNFGPFSSKVYQAVETLEAANLVTDSASLAASGEDSWESDEIIGDDPASRYTTRDFELTPTGERYYRALLKELPQDTEKIVQGLKDKFAGLPLRQLIRYVYSRHDDWDTGVTLPRRTGWQLCGTLRPTSRKGHTVSEIQISETTVSTSRETVYRWADGYRPNIVDTLARKFQNCILATATITDYDDGDSYVSLYGYPVQKDGTVRRGGTSIFNPDAEAEILAQHKARFPR